MTVIEEVSLSEERKRAFRICQEARRHKFYYVSPNFDPNSPVWHYKTRGRCEICGTERLQALDVYGTVIYSAYDWPDGYSDEFQKMPTPAELRIANARKHGESRYSSTNQRQIEEDIEERVLAAVG